ncbi:hypothetical protein HPK19_11905 [Arthrobacter citreus]|nr:hypothetical protein HPK19_11905 [Arthrobacter citreus]
MDNLGNKKELIFELIELLKSFDDDQRELALKIVNVMAEHYKEKNAQSLA